MQENKTEVAIFREPEYLSKFDSNKLRVDLVVAKLNAITIIKTIEECNSAKLALKDAMALEKEIESIRVEVVKAPNEFVKKVNDYAKRELVAKIDKASPANKKVEGAIISFNNEQTRIANEIAKKQREEAEAAERLKREAEAEALRLQQEAAQSEVAPEDEFEAILKVAEAQAKAEAIVVPTPVYIAMPTVSGHTKEKVYEVTDISQIPRTGIYAKYWTLNESELKRDVRSGSLTQMTGIRIYEQDVFKR